MRIVISTPGVEIKFLDYEHLLGVVNEGPVTPPVEEPVKRKKAVKPKAEEPVEPKAEEPPPPADPPAVEPAADEGPQLEEVQHAAVKFAEAKGKTVFVELLSKYGANKLSDLKPDQYAAMLKDLSDA